jgi:hypothetical protein
MEKNKDAVNIDLQEGNTINYVNSGTAGVFIVMSRKMAEIIYPIPEYIKVWFGDNWIYDTLRGLGYRTAVCSDLKAFHYWSKNVSIVKGISQLIEQDKEVWRDRGEKDMRTLISINK